MTRRAPQRVGAVFATVARVVLGALWLWEGTTKVRAGFGAADIGLVAAAAGPNSRVPGYFALFAGDVLGPLAGLFGVVIPLLELALGAALVAGVLTLPAAAASLATLLLYWSSDQLITEYPLMAALSAIVLIWPGAARRFGLTALLRRGRMSATSRWI
ncbi:hypothetical protein ACF044_01660 [Microbacterium sp. NPDC016588]